MSSSLPSATLGTASFADISIDDFVAHVAAHVESAVANAGSGYCCISNVHSIVLANRDKAMAQVYEAADLVYPDSRVLTALVSAVRLRLPKPVQRGDRLLARVLERSGPGTRIALYGGISSAQVQALATQLARDYGVTCDFAESPPFSDAISRRDDGLCERINRAGPQLVVVGLGCPKQELWMFNNAARLNAYCIGVGAAFDYLTGRQADSPAWVHKAGLEWLWRLVTDPARMWRRHAETIGPLLGLLALQVKTNFTSRH